MCFGCIGGIPKSEKSQVLCIELQFEPPMNPSSVLHRLAAFAALLLLTSSVLNARILDDFKDAESSG